MHPTDGDFHDTLHTQDEEQADGGPLIEGRSGAGAGAVEESADSRAGDVWHGAAHSQGNVVTGETSSAGDMGALEDDVTDPTSAEMRGPIEALVLEHPVATALALIGIGYALGRTLSRGSQ